MPRNNSQRQLDNHLTLHGWLNSHFGYKTTRDLLNDVKNAEEGFNANGYSAVCEFFMSRAEPNSVIEQALPVYDSNIKRHLSVINDTRSQRIVLRYFQYLALLYTEIFLDWKFNRPKEFLRQLNDFVQRRNDAKAPGDAMDTNFMDADIEKLAFWMATGAGKTLIMHINYHQFLHYSKEELDHVILITPNEGLSEQHIQEMAASDIRSERFSVEGNNSLHARNTVQVVEITKLVEEKTGEGESVTVEAFEGKNLILVDEGHKGSGGEVWRKVRDKLGETGFTFEYSATFGQALAAAKNADLVDEYGKAIAFDYSYRYFYGDGYGKNFRIFNLKHDEVLQTEILLLGNLLSFYEQRRYFKEEQDVVRAYGLDAPLWAFVGSSVKAISGREKGSDVLNVIRFLHQFLKNEENWAINAIEKILNDDSGLSDDSGNDVFSNRLNYLKDIDETPSQIYAAILDEVFHTGISGALHLQDVRNAPSEIALKTTYGRKEFGVIYIGDTAPFKKLVKSANADINIDSEDVFTESLFSDINNPQSSINILIGAKKFIEGWDSWRVTAMGLLNIGRQEGSQIIQLFGRGVRLRGKNMSLKRSAALDGEHPRNLPLLETLNIFAVRANFMVQFRDYLLREGVELDEKVQLELPIITNTEFLRKGLYLPKAPLYDEVAKGKCVSLEVNTGITVTHNTQSVEIIQSSSENNIQREQTLAALQDVEISDESLSRANWEWIRLQLLEYKQEKQFHNLIFDVETLRRIVSPNERRYRLSVMTESEFKPRSKEELERFEELVLQILRKYIAKFYRLTQQKISTQNMELETINKKSTNFANWKIRVSKKKPQLIRKISETSKEMEQMIKEGDFVYRSPRTGLPEAYIERHLYQPLIVIPKGETTDDLEATPPALEKSEQEFVTDLRNYLDNLRTTVFGPNQVFLLRNQTRGKGIGFYENEGFYPDFILWILEKSKQRIVFIEPHGMVHDAINEHNEKVTLFKRLQTVSDKNESFRRQRVQMDSFIISKTDFSVLSHREGMNKETFAEEWHILFRRPTDPTYLSPIFQESDRASTP